MDTEQTRQGGSSASVCFSSYDSKKEELSRSASYLGLLEVVRDLLHEQSVVTPLHCELSVLEVEAAAARLALSVHGTICEGAVQTREPSYIQQQQNHQFQLIFTSQLINRFRMSGACTAMRLIGLRPCCSHTAYTSQVN